MSGRSESHGFVRVKDRLGGPRGWLKLTQTGWRYYAPQEAARAEPIGDPLRCFVLTEAEVKKQFGEGATFDGFEVTL
jgi:hypothetical protein